MSVEIGELPKEITTLINLLRNKLRQHGFAYGAIYCRKTGFGDVLMIAENMAEDAKQEMLTDLIAAAVQAKKRFQT